MSRPTWDEMKRARDGTTKPLIPGPGETSGDVAYVRSLRIRLQRVDGEIRDAEEAAADVEERLSEALGKRKKIEEELKALGEDVRNRWGELV